MRNDIMNINNYQPKIDTLGFAIPDAGDVKLVDENATKETTSLFVYLKNISGKATIFGHQNANSFGATLTIKYESATGYESDVYSAVGDYPGVFGFDSLEFNNTSDDYALERYAYFAKIAYEKGAVITMCSHMPNFVTNGNSWDHSSGSPVQKILTQSDGGKAREALNAYLDDIVKWAGLIVDRDGAPIPVIFRPYHENNGDWFWWGTPSYCTPAEFKELWRYTVDYIKSKGVNNFLYAYSPNAEFTREKYLEGYPGDDYVDVLGFDCYGNSETFFNNLVSSARVVALLAEEKGKVASITEIGISSNGSYAAEELVNNPITSKWYMTMLEKLKRDPEARKLSYIVAWYNDSEGWYFVPYAEEQVGYRDFVSFFNDRYTAFASQLENVYDLYND